MPTPTCHSPLGIWGPGQLFAFSGLDGPTDWELGLTARSSAGGTGLSIMLPARCEISISRKPPVRAQFGGDWFILKTREGTTRGAFVDTHHLLLAGPCSVRGDDPAIAVVRSAGRTLVAPASKLKRELLTYDLDRALLARMRWMNARALTATSPERRATITKALSIMKTQVHTPQGCIRHRFTTPDRWPHRGMWLWDSAFHAIGWRHINGGLARDMIDAVFDGQLDDGMVPIRTDPAGPTSREMTQPPVLALAASLVDAAEPDTAWIEQLYPKLARYVKWDLAHRDSDGAGLVEWQIEGNPECRSGESGMDNSSRFDCALALDATDFNAFLAHECELLADFARCLGRDADERAWREQHRRLSDLINRRLWNEEAGLYVDCVAETGRQSDVLAGNGFLPLICGAATPEQAARLAAHLTNPRTFGTPLPIPTISASQPQYYSKDMWRGPVWVSLNWLVARGLERYGYTELAAMVRDKTVAEIERHYVKHGVIFEFYDDRREVAPPKLLRKGKNAPDESPLHQVIFDYGWSATLYLDMVPGRGG